MVPAFDLLYMQEREIAVLCIWTAEFCLNCMFCAVNWFGLMYSSQEMESTQYEAFLPVTL